MDISIIIVNYNVKYFLKQALLSVEKAMHGIDGEVFVVDNDSKDDSCEMVRRHFPEVILIENKENVGFAKANNQAILQAKGRYVLLLNPDTVLEENTLRKCIEFMDQTPDCGGLGVKMIDGSGQFLPESKRGFPSPAASFYKLSGISSLFPKSKYFSGYYLGHLSENENQEVDVLAGAFMMMRKEALDKVGLLDETYFMYGEDIDLSYRIQKGGYKNYYLAETSIIHYKGESTKRDSIKYVRIFYKAMIIFAKKHFAGRKAKLFIFLLNIAIYLKAGITLVKNLFKRFFFPVVDGILFFIAVFLAKKFWANYYFHQPDYYPAQFMRINAPLYVGVWILSVFFNGGYDKPFNIRWLVRGVLLGSFGIAAIYGFLDLEYRTSRAVILISTLIVLFLAFLFRMIVHYAKYGHWAIGKSQPKKLVFAGSISEAERAQNLMLRTGNEKNYIGTVSPDKDYDAKSFLAGIGDLDQVVRIYDVDELVFCSKDIESSDIIHWMGVLGPEIHYKILPKDSMSIIGSSSKNSQGELYVEEVKFAIATPTNRRNKRFLDISLSLLFLVLSPILVWFIRDKGSFLQNIFDVLRGHRTWVGYFEMASTKDYPAIPKAVLPPLVNPNIHLDEPTMNRLNFLYAKNYSVETDLELIFKHFGALGNR